MPDTDTFFKFLITLALAENHQLYKLIVVDKGDSVKRKYDLLLEPMFRERRLVYSSMGLGQFVSNNGSYQHQLGRGEMLGSISLYGGWKAPEWEQ